MTTTKSLLFDEEEFMRRNRYKASQVHRNGIITNGEDDAYIQVNLTQRVLTHLEDKFLNFLKGKALPF